MPRRAVIFIGFILIFAYVTTYYLYNYSLYTETYSTDDFRDSIDRVFEANMGITQGSMSGVAIMLIFYRLRRKHQATFASTRLTHGSWNDNQTVKIDPQIAVVNSATKFQSISSQYVQALAKCEDSGVSA